MCVSQNNKLFFAIVLGIFLASGCSGHSVKYGANSEGDGMVSDEEMVGTDGTQFDGVARNSDGTLMYGKVDGTNPNLQSSQNGEANKSEGHSEMEETSSPSSNSGTVANYGRQYGGVDGSGPNHGPVTGFGSGSAPSSNPDPETWANTYLREKGSSQGFYGDPSTAGSGQMNDSGMNPDQRAEMTPEGWAQAYVKENGGPSPEYVSPDTNIAQTHNSEAPSMGISDASGEVVEVRTSRGIPEGSVQDIYFAFDSWSISAEGAKYLEEDAKWLHANPGKALTIEGHCDQRGTQDYNLVLGKKRAEAAREYLVNLGVQPHRIKIVSYGKERPFCKSNTEDCFQENRRNHMVVRINQS